MRCFKCVWFLCDPMGWSLSSSSVHRILQARILEWVALSSFRGSSWPRKICTACSAEADSLLLSHQGSPDIYPAAAAAKSHQCVWLCATPWTAAYQAPPSMGFSRQEYWSGSPLIYPEQTVIQKDPFTQMFTVALLTIARTWMQPKCPSTDEWIRRCDTYIQWNINKP